MAGGGVGGEPNPFSRNLPLQRATLFFNNCPWNGWELMEGQTGRVQKAECTSGDPVRTNDLAGGKKTLIAIEK